MNERRSFVVELLTVAGFCAFLLYFGAGSLGLTGADEPRYAQIAREMLASGDWVTPTLYGQHWFEKPILYYWSAAAAYKLFGVSDWAARLPAATFACAVVFAIYFFLRRFRPGAQMDGALIAASTVALIGFGRSAGPDMLLSAGFAIGMISWMAWYLGGERRWLAVFYFFMALGMLAKGPVAPGLAGLIIVVFALVRREPRAILRTLWLPGIALFLAVALPWYVLVQLRNPDFFRVFVLEHNLARFGTNLYRHQQPFWFYVPVILLALLPWTVYWVAAVVHALRKLRVRDDGLRAFLLLWVFGIIAFFSVAQSKLPGYILPVVPGCALLLADFLRERAAEKAGLGLAAAHALVLAALVVGVVAAPYAVAKAEPPRVVSGMLAAGVFVGAVWTLRAKGLRTLRLVTLAPVIVLLAFLLRPAAPALDARVSVRAAAAELDRIDGRRSQVAIYRLSRQAGYGMAFYRDQRVTWYEPAYFDQPGGVPAGDHMVFAPPGSEEAIAQAAGGRRVSRVGEFAPQKMAFYWVSPAPQGHAH